MNHFVLKLKLVSLLFIPALCCAGAPDTVKMKTQHFIAFNAGQGRTIKHTDFLNSVPNNTSLSLKYGIASKGAGWKEYAFGLPYVGIGLYAVNFYSRDKIGFPFSVYVFQGADLFRFTPRSSINYEFNLGFSFNWKCYDPFDNYENIAIGSPTNIHFGASLYYKWKMARKFDLNAGLGFNHFSNGGRLYPNYGINIYGAFVELAYYFNREEPFLPKKSPYEYPEIKGSNRHEVLFLLSSRNTVVDTVGTGLASPYTERNFKVFGLSYSYLISSSHRFSWGPSAELSYDESAGIRAWREQHPATGRYFDRVELGRFSERFSLGLSAKGELRMPYYAAFAHLGYDVLHAAVDYPRFYQIIGVKLYLTHRFFTTFAVRAAYFSKVQYMYINFGYTIPQRRGKQAAYRR